MKITSFTFSDLLDRNLGVFFFHITKRRNESLYHGIETYHQSAIDSISPDHPVTLDMSAPFSSFNLELGYIPRLIDHHDDDTSSYIPAMKFLGFDKIEPPKKGEGNDILSAVSDLQNAIMGYVNHHIPSQKGEKPNILTKVFNREKYTRNKLQYQTVTTFIESEKFYNTQKSFIKNMFSYQNIEQDMPFEYYIAEFIDLDHVWSVDKETRDVTRLSLLCQGFRLEGQLFYPQYKLESKDKSWSRTITLKYGDDIEDIFGKDGEHENKVLFKTEKEAIAFSRYA